MMVMMSNILKVLCVSKTIAVADDDNAAAVAAAAAAAAAAARPAGGTAVGTAFAADTERDHDGSGGGGKARGTYNVTAAEVLILRLDKPEIVDSFPLPYTSGPVVAAKYAQCQSDGSHYGGLSYTSTHCYLMCPRGVYVLRVLKSSELVLWLVKNKRYPQAMHLCQQTYKREQVFMEVADMHATNLWRQGRFVEAVRVWGEVILPSAPAKYWTIFVNRLNRAGKLGLIVKWLPFNDRTKVSPEIYETLLRAPLSARDYMTMLSRISRWPVLYGTVEIQRDLLRELKELGATYPIAAAWLKTPAAADAKVLLASLFKLYEFGSQFCEALQVALFLEQMRHIAVETSDELLAGLDDASYARALENTLDALQKLRSSDYFITRRLFCVLTSELLPSEVDDGGDAAVTAAVTASDGIRGGGAVVGTAVAADDGAAAGGIFRAGAPPSNRMDASASASASAALPKSENAVGNSSAAGTEGPPEAIAGEGATLGRSSSLSRASPPPQLDLEEEATTRSMPVSVGGDDGDDVSAQLAESVAFYDPLYAGRLILTRAELYHSPIRRVELLRSLLKLDDETVIQAIVDHHHQVSISELAASDNSHSSSLFFKKKLT